ncbi:MAG: hypothetical protein IKG00_05000 [Lachnospiraceae bacterium]|nr:hypothetical protein [Lachnospiraceae bacterium]
MDNESVTDEIIRVLEEMKQARLKKSCSRDSLNQANAFQIAIAVVKEVIKRHEQTNKP